jgi:hypothetical protein
MNLLNETGLQAGYNLGVAPDGRESLVVVVKGTYAFPARDGREPAPAEEQEPLVMADVFTGEPGFSATLYENDFAPRKPRCDVLLNGSAYAPGGKPAARVTVGLRVGALAKSFDVVGPRVYKAGALYIAVSDPEPFAVLPISYDNAFGGVDRSSEDPARHRWYLLNHAGVGFHADTSAQALNGKPLPNTEETGRPVTRPQGNYNPMALGPVGRSWQPRIKLAGTYDQHWQDNVLPYLPADFDDRYYQAAPADQQTDHLRGGEEVVLTNLTPQGRTSFPLPRGRPGVRFRLRDGRTAAAEPALDTVILEPDRKRVMLVWRAALPLRRTLAEVVSVVASKPAPG